MKSYTVVLRRPEAVYDTWDVGEFIHARDSYTALVQADCWKEAIKKAKKEVRRWDGTKGVKARDYVTLLVFEGWHEPLFYGWQTGVEQ